MQFTRCPGHTLLFETAYFSSAWRKAAIRSQRGKQMKYRNKSVNISLVVCGKRLNLSRDNTLHSAGGLNHVIMYWFVFKEKLHIPKIPKLSVELFQQETSNSPEFDLEKLTTRLSV